MNISLFNSFEKLNVANKQSFQGLWGKTSRSSDFDQVLGIPKVEEVCYYYPFNDETPEQIQSVIDKNTSLINRVTSLGIYTGLALKFDLSKNNQNFLVGISSGVQFNPSA